MNGIKKWLDSITTRGSQRSQTSAQEQENKSQSLTIERDIIEGTAFTIIGTPTEGYWLTMGKHRISKAYKTKKEVMKHVNKKEWSMITAIIIAFIHDRKLVDSAYTKDTAIPPDEKSQQLAMEITTK